MNLSQKVGWIHHHIYWWHPHVFQSHERTYGAPKVCFEETKGELILCKSNKKWICPERNELPWAYTVVSNGNKEVWGIKY